MKHITLKEMLETEVYNILNGYPINSTYYWKDGDNQYHKIVELDLLRGRFITNNGDFSEFEWELDESRIYMEIK